MYVLDNCNLDVFIVGIRRSCRRDREENTNVISSSLEFTWHKKEESKVFLKSNTITPLIIIYSLQYLSILITQGIQRHWYTLELFQPMLQPNTERALEQKPLKSNGLLEKRCIYKLTNVRKTGLENVLLITLI